MLQLSQASAFSSRFLLLPPVASSCLFLHSLFAFVFVSRFSDLVSRAIASQIRNSAAPMATYTQFQLFFSAVFLAFIQLFLLPLQRVIGA